MLYTCGVDRVGYSSNYITVLTVLSSFAVMMLHFNGVFWMHPEGSLWVSSNIIETVFYFAVPVFFMITGCTLLDYRELYSTRTFFCKRFIKTVLPFVVWSLIAYLYRCVSQGVWCFSPYFVAKGILNCRFIDIYWFFILLFGIYLSIPVLALLPDKVRVFTYMSALAFCTSCLPDFISQATGSSFFPRNFSFPLCSGYLIYPLLGYVLHKADLRPAVRVLIYIAGAASAVAHCIVTITLSDYDGICLLFKNYRHCTTVFFAAAVFVAVKYRAAAILTLAPLRRLIEYVKPTTLGVYLTHIYLYWFCGYVGVNTSSLLFRTVGTCFLFVVLAWSIRQVQKLRIGRVLLP